MVGNILFFGIYGNGAMRAFMTSHLLLLAGLLVMETTLDLISKLLILILLYCIPSIMTDLFCYSLISVIIPDSFLNIYYCFFSNTFYCLWDSIRLQYDLSCWRIVDNILDYSYSEYAFSFSYLLFSFAFYIDRNSF